MKETASVTRVRTAIILLAVIHMVGIAGLHIVSLRAIFEYLSWLNMLFSFVIVVAMYRYWSGTQLIFVAVSFIAGMASEIIGVQLGWLFGDYHYDRVAGPWVLGVPVVIGLNWTLLSICTGTLAGALLQHTAARLLVATLLMVGIDILLERFAISHHLWVWRTGPNPPLMNYLSWAAVAFALQCLYIVLWRDQGNKVAIAYLIVLILFLLADRFFDHHSIHMGTCQGPHHLISFDHGVKRTA